MIFKEKLNKFKKSAIEFWNENKTMIIAVGGFIAGTFVTYKIMKSDIEYPAPPYTPIYIPEENNANPKSEPEKDDKWDEETMRENWDWVCELASNMEMGADEEYHIYSSDFDIDGVRIGDNIVSHMVCGDEVYPDDVEEYEELYDSDNDEDEDDDEEEEDEENEKDEVEEMVIKVPSGNKDLVDLARQFTEFCNSGEIEVLHF